ncbi:uncharacterized protein LOC132644118 [Lycium barbarum]|uniref:uncharacterized protein LOC132644118 n=1 Tax=Lycium barbarum TaxID=112863 RepID=UPI00293E81A1|nr:uncharacterized protein LOC132644118 [Lycium barbarum]
MTWFEDGDKNSKFFHAHVNGRRNMLQLRRMQNSQGQRLKEEEDMAEKAVRFFQAQFHETVLMDFQAYSFNLAGILLEMIFSTWCGTFSENQAGFVKGRSIVENILLTQEIITDIRIRTTRNNKQDVPNVVMKLDMTKAYDSLSWIFLTNVLRKMGFCERFISFIFEITGNNWYSVLLNGQPHGFFHSTRGVKQSDPLSSTLFILAAEVLPRSLNSLHDNPWFCGFGLPKWSPLINHLAYADDTIIF